MAFDLPTQCYIYIHTHIYVCVCVFGIFNRMDTSTDAAVASLPPNILTTNDQITAIISSYINEEKEKAKRKLNLIIQNVGETTFGDGLKRKKEYIDMFLQYFSSI